MVIGNIFLTEDKRNMMELTYRLLPYTMGGSKALENAFEIVQRVDNKQVSGAIVECGVAKGGTAAMMAMASLKITGQLKECWFFDSFEGLPEPTENDFIEGVAGTFIRPLEKGSCKGSFEQVSDLMFNTLDLSREKVFLIQGWFNETIPKFRYEIEEISILRLDGDWYESTLIPLQNLYPLVSDKGIVIVDDYSTCYGSKKAVDEYRQAHNITSPLYSDKRGGVWFEKPERS